MERTHVRVIYGQRFSRLRDRQYTIRRPDSVNSFNEVTIYKRGSATLYSRSNSRVYESPRAHITLNRTGSDLMDAFFSPPSVTFMLLSACYGLFPLLMFASYCVGFSGTLILSSIPLFALYAHYMKNSKKALIALTVLLFAGVIHCTGVAVRMDR